ncbi:hypothetical protein G4B88_030071 [Cannabis sativa]|uniref:CCHC-type domain-containing protein n=1 Tax=Cannabis sativa TaxID=3483 RepID=A0A7J6FSV4_CANSA|nr:hypothetical protein G4B88_030071 [Cannabis sativa]
MLMVSGTTDDAVEEIVNMASQLAVETEDEWEVNEEEAKEFAEKTVIGKVISKKSMNGKLFHSIFSRMWKNIRDWKVKVLEVVDASTYVRISFDTKENARDARLDRVSCWVKLKGFELKSFTLNNVRRLAQLAGDVLKIKWSNPQQAFMNGYVRVKIGFPLNKNIFVGRFVPAGGTRSWVQFKFERMPMLCFKCGLWGHEQIDCKEEPAMEDIGNGLKVLKYGYWLKDEHPTPNCIVAHQQYISQEIHGTDKTSGSDDGLTEKAAVYADQSEIGSSSGAVVVPRDQEHDSLKVSGVVISEFGGKEMENVNTSKKPNGPDTFVSPKDFTHMEYRDEEAHDFNDNEHISNRGIQSQGHIAGAEVGIGNFQNTNRKRGRDIIVEDEGEGGQKKRKGAVGFVVSADDVENGKKNKGKGILGCQLSSPIEKEVFIVSSVPLDDKKGKKGVLHGHRKKISIKTRARNVNRQNVGMGNMSMEQLVGREVGSSAAGCSQEGPGGLLLLWKDDINIRVDSSSPGHILVEVVGKDFLPWTLTCFYGHPDATQRKFSWELLRNIKAGVHGAWLCIGDFNEIVSLAEKVGGRTRCSAAMGLCNAEWLRCFEGADIQVLDWWESDHRPLVVDLPVALEHDRCGQTKRKTRFHFEEAWCDDDECKDIVLNGWQDGMEQKEEEVVE